MKIKIGLLCLLILLGRGAACAVTVAPEYPEQDSSIQPVTATGAAEEERPVTTTGTAEDYKGRLDRLEAEMKELQQKQVTDLNVDVLLQAWFYIDQKPGADGALRLPADNGFEVHRTEITLAGQAASNISWLLMIDPAHAVGTSQTNPGLGDTLTNTATLQNIDSLNFQLKRILQDAVISAAISSSGSLQIGQALVPFGMEGLVPDKDLLFVERSPITTVLGWSYARDIGVEYSDSFKWPGWVATLELGLYDGDGENAEEINYVKDPAARITVQFPCGLRLGISHYEGRDYTEEADYIGSPSNFNFHTGYEFYWNLSPFLWEGEYVQGNRLGTGKQAAYNDLAYQLCPSLQLVTRYDWYTTNDTDWDGSQQYEATVGLNIFFDPAHPYSTKVQINGVASGKGSPFDYNDDLQARINCQVYY